MITTQELTDWYNTVAKTKASAERYANDNKYNEKLSAYYTNMAEVSSIQLAILDRLIAQSEKNNEENKMTTPYIKDQLDEIERVIKEEEDRHKDRYTYDPIEGDD